MTPVQRYVSVELTHFAGRLLPNDEERYKCLLEILRKGVLGRGGPGWGFGTAYAQKMSENKMYSADVVCFCDIPVDDLGVHMSKYSKFGIAFLKSFLVQRGANPVFYIAKESKVPIWFKIMEPGRQAPSTPRSWAEAFDGMVPEYIKLTDEVRALFVPKDNPTLVTPENYQRVHDVRKFIDALLLCFVKFFESSSADDDPTNFYMEREWRMLGALKFDLADVRRIIIPGTFAVRFREDLPQYAGQVSFAD